jgi:rubrerythrin
MGRFEDVSRADWLKRGFALAAGLTSAGIVVGGFAPFASSAGSSSRDEEVLNLALAFEELQSDFYAQASKSVQLRGDWREFAEVVGGHEREHVTFLKGKLGAAAKPAPQLRLTRAPTSRAEFQRLAVAFEDAGVAFYNGQAGNLTPDTLAVAAEIVSVEARHAAWARDLAGEIPAPVPTDPPADEKQVIDRLSKLGVTVG